MKQVPLTQGKVALVDDEDYEAVSQFKWYAVRPKREGGVWYAQRCDMKDGRKVTTLLHRFITGFEGHVDHRDGDGLNNTRGNLREVTRSQNMRNKRPGVNTSSRYVGVTRRPNGTWNAQIETKVGGVRQGRSLGIFTTEEDAARARDRAAFERDPEYCYLNFPEEYGR